MTGYLIYFQIGNYVNPGNSNNSNISVDPSCCDSAVKSNIELYRCDCCPKSYKTKNGLARHYKAKHQQEDTMKKLHPLNLKVIVRDSAEKLSKDLAFPENLRTQLSGYSITSDEALIIWKQFKPVFDGFNGSAEKFYSKMFRFSLPDMPQIFTSLSRVLSNLLITEISTGCLEYLVGKKNKSSDQILSLKWDDKSKYVVEYLAGYCFRTIFTRLHRSKKRDRPEIQQLISLLKSAKLNDNKSDLVQKQRLIIIKDCGGLWALNKTAVRIFEVCEEEFYVSSQGFKRSIDVNEMVIDLCKDIIIKSNFKDLCRQLDTPIDGEISKNLLEKLIQLYLRVRSHANAKSIKEKAKLDSRENKKKSLRVELKRATDVEKK